MMKTNINSQTRPVPGAGRIIARSSKGAVTQLFCVLVSRCPLCLWKSPESSQCCSERKGWGAPVAARSEIPLSPLA